MRRLVVPLFVLASLVFPTIASADHAWGPYHWAREANPFDLDLVDGVSATWDGFLVEASDDWSASSVLDTHVVAGDLNVRSCRGDAGTVAVCSAAYGNNGWLGLASISVKGVHITRAFVKVNDTYFDAEPYDSDAWRRFVMCQEVGHAFGLDHQDEDFDNENLGTCMDYTSDPDGGQGEPSNEHPDAHDYEQLEEIYAHVDDTTTVGVASATGRGSRGWGTAIRTSPDGSETLFVRHLAGGRAVFTFVLWAP